MKKKKSINLPLILKSVLVVMFMVMAIVTKNPMYYLIAGVYEVAATLEERWF